MEQLSSLDSAFVYLETRSTPMHVGGVHIYEGKGEPFDFNYYRELVKSRLHLSPVFRRRAVSVPMSLGRPYWIDDPEFDLDVHLEHVSLPKPGGWKQLREVARDRFSTPMDFGRPLWSLTFVDGLDGIKELPAHSFAMIGKLHHAAADGMGSMDVFTALWDPSAEVREFAEADNWEPEEPPGRLSLVARTLAHVTRQPGTVARTAADLLKGGYGLGREWLGKDSHAPQLLFTAPRTRFNQIVERRRSFGGVSLSLNGVKAIRTAVKGSTVNDVVLAICSGGLRRYLAATDELPEKTLVAMAPISVREDVTEGANAVSAMLVPLATDEPNALRRFRKIHNAAIDSKAYTKAVGAARLTDATQVVPFSLAMAASRLYSGMKVARLHRPPFNLVITNVPGPRVPLYLGGARLYNLFGMAPVVDGLGVLIVVTSYINHLTISVTGSRGLLPDVDVLLGSIKSSYRELSRAAKAKKQRRAGKKTKRETS